MGSEPRDSLTAPSNQQILILNLKYFITHFCFLIIIQKDININMNIANLNRYLMATNI